MPKKKILIVAGEPSGDLHASNLVKNILTFRPDTEFFGLGGELSKKSGVDVIFDISTLSLVGLLEVWKNILVVKKVFDGILSKIDTDKPDLAILVDYPGFNLRLAKELKKRNIPVVYYISPQVWAWGRDRIELIKRYVDKIIVFFKFEEELYKTYGVNAEFVGHPLVDSVNITMSKDEVFKIYGLAHNKKTIALLPGSRINEIKSILNVMASAAKIIDAKLPNIQFIIAKYPGLSKSLYDEALKGAGFDIKIAENDTHNIVAASDFAIVTSGTATLETALIKTPFVIVYKASLITYLAYLFVAKIRFIGLPNVICNKMVVPELLQHNATPENIASTVIGLLDDKIKLRNMRSAFETVNASLGTPGASLRAAKAIIPFLTAS
jgi:lipid-A-disaccharide synthase